jgi:transcriptional regulator with XRE-family HTH domain
MKTSDQLRAARALIRWDQKDLAQRSGVSVPTIKRLEAQPGNLSANVPTLAAIRRALEVAGVIFVAENGEGAGVRLRQRAAQVSPSENDLLVEFDHGSGECFATCDGVRKFLGVFESRELAETASEEYQRELDWHKAKLEHPKG